MPVRDLIMSASGASASTPKLTEVGSGSANYPGPFVAIVNPSQTIPAGSLIIVGVRDYYGDGTLTDDAGNTYYVACSKLNPDVAYHSAVWYCYNCNTVTSANTIAYTAYNGGTNNPLSISVSFAIGMKTTSSVLSQTATASGYDELGFFTIDGGTTWQGFVLGKAMA